MLVSRFEERWRDGERAAFAIECGSGTYVRSLIAELGDAYCLELRRTRIGPFDVADAGTFLPLGRRARLPARGAAGGGGRPARRPRDGRRRRRPAAAAPAGSGGPAQDVVRLLDADGLVALAEPRGDGTLKPVVGFRG